MFNPSSSYDLLDERRCLRCFAQVEGFQDWTFERLQAELDDADPSRRVQALASFMACARPDDVIDVVGLEGILDDWCHVEELLLWGAPSAWWLWRTLVECCLGREEKGPVQ